MPKRSDTPLEERNYSHIYFFLAGLLALSTFWAIWDMIRSRAPWQGYQMELNQQEHVNIEKELRAENDKLNTKHGKKLQSLHDKLAEANAKLQGEAYSATISELEQSEVELEKAMQNYRFAKSEYDALWYEYKHAQYTGGVEAAQKIRPQVDELNTEVVGLKTKWDEAEAKKAEIEERIDGYSRDAAAIQAQIDELNKPVAELAERIERIKDRKVKIQQFVLDDFVRGNFESYLDQVDRCTSCHVNSDKGGYDDYDVPYKSHPNRDPLLKIHPVNRFGCTPCHDGQGEALRIPHAHGEVEHWEHPLLSDGLVEAGCNKCHSSEMRVEHAPRLTKAKHMVFDLACYACHDIAGYENMRKIGPPLNSITSKVSTEFIYRWVKDTKSFRQHSRMPNPQFTHDEAVAVVAYLNAIAKDTDYTVPKAPSGGSSSRGERLVETIGCKGCHVLTEEDREVKVADVTHDVAPELTKVASKIGRDWIYAWIKNPKQYNPNTTMPRLRLTNQEALDITAFLMTRKEGNTPAPGLQGIDLDSPELIDEGKAIIRNFGCHGCHEIEGMEREGKVSVSLNEFGGKTHDELFYGDALANGDVKEETWDDWTLAKMKNSRLYATEAVMQRMPNFVFNEDDAETMTMILKSWDGRKIGAKYLHNQGRLGEALEKGRRLVRQYNCVGCHIIEGDGGFIRPTIAAAFKRQGRDESLAASFSPPDLIGEGRKVQPDWLFNFLRDPTTQIRPWLDIRMPTFGFTAAEANILIEYFQALEGMSKPFLEMNIELTKAEINAAEKLFSPDLLSCFSCHQVGDKKPEGGPEGWAPDFLLAPKRLNPDWVFDWIANPNSLQPGTKMPGFYPDAALALPDILGGDAEKQIEAIRDYLMNIDKFASRL